MDSLLLFQSLFFATLAVAVLVVIVIGLILYRNSKRLALYKLQKKESEELKDRLLMIIKAARMSTWDINVMERSIDFNFENFTPLQDTGHYTTTIDRYYAALYPGDLEKIQQSYIEILNGEKDFFHEEYRVKFPGSSDYRWIESFAIIAQKDEAGIPLSLVGASLLIEERKK